MEFDLVIKVKYGDTMRRFNAFVSENDMKLDMAALTDKIRTFFNLSSDADLILTYIDEDKDLVTLVEDEDLRDAIFFQHLNPLKINVTLNSKDKSSPSPSHPRSQGGTPLRSPRFQAQPTSTSSGFEEVMKTVPEPLRDALLKLSSDLMMKATTSAPIISDLVTCATNLGLTSLGQPSQGLAGGTSSGAPGSKSHPTVDLRLSPESSMDSSILPVVGKVADQMPLFKEDACNEKGKTTPSSLVTPVDCSEYEGGVASTFKAPAADTEQHKKNVDKPVDLLTGDSELSGLTKIPVSENGLKNKLLSDSLGLSVESEGFSPDCGVVIAENMGEVADPHHGFSRFERRPFKRSSSHHESMLRTFHRGVQCDGCGMHPIVGPRFKSKVKEDYDLCNICFSEMGNEDEYTRIDRALYRPPRSFKGFCGPPHPPRFSIPVVPFKGHGLKLCKPKLESRFIQDVTVIDGTVMPPSTPFTKIWRMRNNGTMAWPILTQLVWIGGDQFGDRGSVELEIPPHGLRVDEVLDIAVDFTAPSRPGRYISYWRMASPSGQKFGQRVWVLIQVDVSDKDTKPSSFHPDLNLNLPPVIGVTDLKRNGLIDVNVEPTESDPVETNYAFVAAEQVEPLIPEKMSKGIETDFPVDNGSGLSGSVSYPIIDVSETNDAYVAAEQVEPLLPEKTSKGIETDFPADNGSGLSDSVSYPIVDVSESTGTTGATLLQSETTNPIEDTLLKELEEMGFKQIDLNKEVLRKNDYKLESSLDDLCGMYEWNPSESVEADFPVDKSDKLSGSVSYPVVDVPELPPSPAGATWQPKERTNPTEEALLKELEEMGFNQIDLNREVLRKHDYKLESALDDLCGISGWDPILEELQEMGFSDRELNKRLLIKNTGSIMRVVLDLVAEEKK